MPIKYYSKNKNFHPILILSNIGLLVSFQFIIRYIIVQVINRLFNINFHNDQIIGSSQFGFDSIYTYSAIISSCFESIIMIFSFVFIVEKANRILDYVMTNLVFELIIIWVFTGFPGSFSFWVFSTIRISVVTLIAEYISLKIEQKEISINSNFMSGTI